MANYMNCFYVSAHCPVSSTVYGYAPSLPANAILLTVFSLVAVVQLIQGVTWKAWGFMIAFVLGSSCEVIGYSARLMLHSNPWSHDSLLIQMFCLTVGLIFYCTGMYLCYSRLAEILKPTISLIDLAPYPLISASCNILPFVLQGSGSILSIRAIQKGSDLSTGTHLIIAGLAFQIATLLLFGLLCLEFGIRAHLNRSIIDLLTKRVRSTKRFRFFCVALTYAYVFITIRCVYRVTELSAGWRSKLVRNESNFIALEGMMVLAVGYVMSLAHPGYVFKEPLLINEKVLSNDKASLL